MFVEEVNKNGQKYRFELQEIDSVKEKWNGSVRYFRFCYLKLKLDK